MALKETVRGLARHTAVYSLGWIAGSISSILLLPVYTRFLSRADYGIVEIIQQANGVLRIILLSGFNFSVAKFYHATESADGRRRAISTSVVSVILVGALGCCAAFFMQERLGELLFRRSDASSFVQVGSLILFCDLLFFVFTIHLTIQKKSKLFVVLGFVKLFTAIGFNLFFIVYLGMGAMGMLYGNLISYGVAAAVAGVSCLKENGVSFDWALAKRMLSYGLPMVPASLCGAVMHNADRFLVLKYCSLDDVGLYGLGYSFPMILNALLLSSFNLVWSGSVLFEVSQQKDAAYQYGRIATYFITIFVFCQLALVVFATSLLKILAAPKFFQAHQIIPFVAMGLSFHVFYTFFTAGAFVKGKTSRLIIAYFPAAFCNIALNILLLPRFGYVAAAWVSTITYGLFAVLAYFSCRKLLNIFFEFRRLTFVFVTASFCYALSKVTYMDDLRWDIPIQTGLMILFLAGLVYGGFLTLGERKVLHQKVCSIWSLTFKGGVFARR